MCTNPVRPQLRQPLVAFLDEGPQDRIDDPGAAPGAHRSTVLPGEDPQIAVTGQVRGAGQQ